MMKGDHGPTKIVIYIYIYIYIYTRDNEKQKIDSLQICEPCSRLNLVLWYV